MSIFNQSQSTRIKKNKFDLSHDKKLSLQMGKLVPILLQEILPGDRFRVNSEIMIRFAPMIAPIMHSIDVYTHYFFVPNRILWDEWEEFITGGKDGTSTPIHPFLALSDAGAPAFAPQTLSDYFGLPEIAANPLALEKINVLPYRAYQTIYNEYYRDQTLTPEVIVPKTGGGPGPGEAVEMSTIRMRSWEKDYFTSALPWAQRGPDIGIPISYGDISITKNSSTNNPPTDGAISSTGGVTAVGAQNIRIENLDLAESTISNLRKAVRLQEWLEKNARGGARYIEQLLSHFGKAPKDARLQRPEYLGGGKQPVVISEVLNTAGSTTIDLEPLGEMAGHGISVGSSNGFNKEFEEHGFVLGIMSVLPRTAYMQGIHKMWSRFDKLDYAWPEFAQIGEQEIKDKEIYFTGAVLDEGNGTFGYTPRYSEYKYGCSTVHGEFKTNLDFWHLARKFAAAPQLNADFVEADPDPRIFAVTDPTVDNIYCRVYNNISALRPLPYFGTPKL